MDKFTLRHTNTAKGVAVLLLLWHHLFFNTADYYTLFKTLHLFNGIPIECFVADFFKVCVAIFMFLSGYGLFLSYNKAAAGKKGFMNELSCAVRYVAKRLVKLLSDYWVVFVIFVPLGLLRGRSFIEIYAGNIFKYLADIFGVSFLIYGYDATVNVTWWYMGVIIAFYIIFPILYKLEKISGELLVMLASAVMLFLPKIITMKYNISELTLWILPFCLGMYFADKDILGRLIRQWKGKKLVPAIVCMLMMLVCAAVRYAHLGIYMDSFFALSVILFSIFVVAKIPVVRNVIETYGKYSGLIFMFHTFIIGYYFKEFTYSFKYSLLIFAVSAAICLAVAFIIEQIKRLSGYNKLIALVCGRLDGKKLKEKETAK